MLSAEHDPDSAGAVGEFVQQHRQGDDPADLTACLKRPTDGEAVEKAVYTNAGCPPGPDLAGMVIVGGMILRLAVVGCMLKQVEAQKPQATGKQEVVRVKAALRGRLQQLQSIRDDVQQGRGDQRSGTKSENESTVRLEPQSDKPAAECH